MCTFQYRCIIFIGPVHFFLTLSFHSLLFSVSVISHFLFYPLAFLSSFLCIYFLPTFFVPLSFICVSFFSLFSSFLLSILSLCFFASLPSFLSVLFISGVLYFFCLLLCYFLHPPLHLSLCTSGACQLTLPSLFSD
jgi:hypothetical protein